MVFVGRLNEDKGIEIALQILGHMPEDYTLHMAGQGDLGKRIPKEHPIFDRVIYHGVLKPMELRHSCCQLSIGSHLEE